ncbi:MULTISPECIES: TfoX/Sxy family protein [unclassified Rhizobium]|uniref:TfoX/Sxy family protein n=1 Tax=unclassified Rhizobium TaxID=2613769 RepID=UPI000EA8F415|nr:MULTISPECIES: TfoX/Sxy family protein [unclassified Rhizobium]AYG67635.1 TfoX family protein [Rhizobium sp. CCGE531]AYG74029.1 TfoX family protein [Rhizobium sp. CCGE532]
MRRSQDFFEIDLATARKPDFVDFLEAEFNRLVKVETLRFFGGWQFRAAGKQFAILMRDVLYFIADPAMRAELEAAGSQPFSYHKDGRLVVVGRYFSAPDDVMDDIDKLHHWTARAINIS